MKTIIMIVLFLVVGVPASAQMVIDTTNPIQFGIYSHIGTNTQRTGGFSQLGTYTKPFAPFQDGKGDVVCFGGEVTLPFSTIFKATRTSSLMFATMRFGFNVFSAKHVANESSLMIQNGVPTPFTISHNLDARFASFGLEPMIGFSPPFLERLRLNTGIRYGWIYSAGFTQQDQLNANDATYIQGTTSRTKYEAQVPNINPTELAGLFGASYTIPLGKRFSIAPEVQYQLPLSNLTSENTWKSELMRFGLSVIVVLPTTKPVLRDTIYQRDTLVRSVPDIARETIDFINSEQKLTINENENVKYEFLHVVERYMKSIPKLKAIETAKIRLSVYEVNKDNEEHQLDSLLCDEVIWNDFQPLLNYVFFEYGSSKLSTKYSQLRPEDTQDFKVYSDQTQIITYYNVLNILAQGMRDNPTATIKIMGTVSKKEKEEIPTWKQLARERAEVVGSYLSYNWGIDTKRMEILAGETPRKPSNEKSLDGIEENQRVEIYSDKSTILDPVLLRDTVLLTETVKLRIRTDIQSKTEILSWKIIGDQDSNVLFQRDGKGITPEYLDIELDRATMRRFLRNERGTFEISLAIEQQGKGTVKSYVSIPVYVRKTEMLRRSNLSTEIDRYILMLFEFGKDNLTPQNERLVRVIRSRINDNSKVKIIGTTDRSGNPDFNKKLSERRATSVSKVIEFPNSKIIGYGIDLETYDNNTPEGRFHARTVRIEVQHHHFSFHPPVLPPEKYIQLRD